MVSPVHLHKEQTRLRRVAVIDKERSLLLVIKEIVDITAMVVNDPHIVYINTGENAQGEGFYYLGSSGFVKHDWDMLAEFILDFQHGENDYLIPEIVTAVAELCQQSRSSDKFALVPLILEIESV